MSVRVVNNWLIVDNDQQTKVTVNIKYIAGFHRTPDGVMLMIAGAPMLVHEPYPDVETALLEAEVK